MAKCIIIVITIVKILPVHFRLLDNGADVSLLTKKVFRNPKLSDVKGRLRNVSGKFMKLRRAITASPAVTFHGTGIQVQFHVRYGAGIC